jgi:Nucleotidyltransferase domain
MQNQPVTEELLQEMTEKIDREINPRKVVLFGSHARGTARPDSDLENKGTGCLLRCNYAKNSKSISGQRLLPHHQSR